MFKQISFSRISNVLLGVFCVATLAIMVSQPVASPKLTAEQMRKVQWLRNEELVGLRQGDFITLQEKTYVVVDSNWRARNDRSLVLNGPGPSSSETAENEMKICLDDNIEALHLSEQLLRGQMIMQKDPYGLKRDAGWEAIASFYWLQ